MFRCNYLFAWYNPLVFSFFFCSVSQTLDEGWSQLNYSIFAGAMDLFLLLSHLIIIWIALGNRCRESVAGRAFLLEAIFRRYEALPTYVSFISTGRNISASFASFASFRQIDFIRYLCFWNTTKCIPYEYHGEWFMISRRRFSIRNVFISDGNCVSLSQIIIGRVIIDLLYHACSRYNRREKIHRWCVTHLSYTFHVWPCSAS